METMIHPARSPDLNPIEAIWGILAQRVRKNSYTSLEELKATVEKE
jgi:transposase